MAVAISGQSHGETDNRVAVKRAEHLPADALRHHKDAPGNQVAVAIAPNLKLQHDAALKLLERRQAVESRCLS